jgi:hypothetical protein
MAIIEGTTTAADEWVQVAAVIPVAVIWAVLNPVPAAVLMVARLALMAVKLVPTAVTAAVEAV